MKSRFLFCACALIAGFFLGTGGMRLTREAAQESVGTGGTATLTLARQASAQPWPSSAEALFDEDSDRVAALYALAHLPAGSGSLAAHLEMISSIVNGHSRARALELILESRFESDPEAAWRACESFDGDETFRLQILKTGAQFWGEQDFDAVRETLEEWRGRAHFPEILCSAILGHGRNDPAAAVSLLLSEGLTGTPHNFRYETLFRDYAELEPAEALRTATKFSRRELIMEVAETWAASDPVSLQAFVESGDFEAGQSDVQAIYGAIGKALIAENPGEAVEWCLGLAEAELLPGRHNVIGSLAKQLVNAFPGHALDLLERSNGVDDVYLEVFRAYAGEDWDAAHDAMLTLEGKAQEYAVKGLIQELANRDTPDIREHLEPLLDRLENPHNIYSSLTKLEPAEILSLVTKYPLHLKNALRDWAREESRVDATAVAGVLAQLPDDVQSTATQSLVNTWAKTDPQATAAWVATLPETETRDYAFRNLMNSWMRHDAENARAWLEEQPPSAHRDRGWQEVINAAARANPEEAIGLASHIDDRDLREGAQVRALKGLLWHDPERAREILETLTLSDAAAKQVEGFAEKHATWKRLARDL